MSINMCKQYTCSCEFILMLIMFTYKFIIIMLICYFTINLLRQTCLLISSKGRGVNPASWPNSPIGLWPWPHNHPHICWLASSLCLLSTSKLVCGERFGALWLPSHHPGGCCTLVVDEEIPPYQVKCFECLEMRYGLACQWTTDLCINCRSIWKQVMEIYCQLRSRLYWWHAHENRMRLIAQLYYI